MMLAYHGYLPQERHKEHQRRLLTTTLVLVLVDTPLLLQNQVCLTSQLLSCILRFFQVFGVCYLTELLGREIYGVKKKEENDWKKKKKQRKKTGLKYLFFKTTYFSMLVTVRHFPLTAHLSAGHHTNYWVKYICTRNNYDRKCVLDHDMIVIIPTSIHTECIYDVCVYVCRYRNVLPGCPHCIQPWRAYMHCLAAFESLRLARICRSGQRSW